MSCGAARRRPQLAFGPYAEARRAALYQVEVLVGDLAERYRSAQVQAPVEVLSGIWGALTLRLPVS
ncbi:hypothetical protein [Streptomyces sp. NBC_01445]|uniref:hypothetical protein n=1 Tax=Streptomyces sp. NBC_01445 TaxID=2903869 RepID=UPI002DD95B21|nr:hypothetical protein [Streptomyces sp. NBC_01445]WSE02171.1 hypothetical protein OG574_01280 [Streptomyces sp. NBC_01445]